MNRTSLIRMLGNLSQSLPSVQHLIAGFAYLLGLILVISALNRLKNSLGSNSHQGIFPAVVYFLGGSLLIFLPMMIEIFSNSAFGSNNVMGFAKFNSFNVRNSVNILVQTIGIIWFVRGTVLIVNASQPGTQHGLKGLIFLSAGIFAMNFNVTVDALNNLINYLGQLNFSNLTN